MAAQELTKTVLYDNAGVISYYRFESDVTDTKAVNNGTATNISYSAGVYGNGAVFNGSTSKVAIGTTNFSTGSGARTQSAWIKLAAQPATNAGMYIITYGAGSSNNLSALIYKDTSGTKYITWGGYANDYDVAQTLSDGVWYHVAVTISSTTARIYLNGKCIGTGTITASNVSAANGYIGIAFDGASAPFNGMIDDAFIANFALSADQIKELYEGRFIGETYPQSGLVAGWHFNGSSTDFSGNNNHGTDTAITYSQANGKFGQGAGFNGTTSSVAVAYSANNAMTASYTASCWVNATALPAVAANLVGNYVAGVNKGYELRYQNFTGAVGEIRSLHGDASTFPAVTATNITITTGLWYHIAATFNGSVMKVYLNGNEVGTNTTSTAVSAHTNTLRLGSLEGSSRYFSGKLDEVVIFSRALSAQEIRRMYALGVGKLQ